VLQYLVAEHHVEGLVRIFQGIPISLREGDIADPLLVRVSHRLCQHARVNVTSLESCDVTLGHRARKVYSDGPWSAANVEDVHPWLEMGEQVAG
jgi:hypothetical protein